MYLKVDRLENGFIGDDEDLVESEEHTKSFKSPEVYMVLNSHVKFPLY